MANEVRKVITPEFRVSFPQLFEKKAMDEKSEPKYSICMLFPKDADLSALRKLAAATVKEKWGDSPPKGLRNPFRDQGEKEFDGYEAGAIFINASSKQRPQVVGPNPKINLEEEQMYPGCYAKASLTCYAYDKAGNKGVSFGLGNVQKTRDGDPLTSRTRAEDDFEAIEGADDFDSDSGNDEYDPFA